MRAEASAACFRWAAVEAAVYGLNARYRCAIFHYAPCRPYKETLMCALLFSFLSVILISGMVEVHRGGG